MKQNIRSLAKSLSIFTFVSTIVFIAGCAILPQNETVSEIIWLEQGWSTEDRQAFHHTSQGTMTIPVPYEWFAALEQPEFKLFGTNGLIINDDYLSRLGFISGEVTPFNQAGLPVGFAVDYNVTNPEISEGKFNAVGLTCAACHTGQMNVKGKSIRYDGGPAMTDLTSLTTILGLALIETYLEHGKFDRFAQRVLGVTNTRTNRNQLKRDLKYTLRSLVQGVVDPSVVKESGMETNQKLALSDDKFIKAIKIIKDVIKDNKNSKPTTEGFTRLDALNRIGNTVFAQDTEILENMATIHAPVNYPHIWNTSWFLWVQYDASIMGPMIRNSGEAMGTSAYVNMDGSSPDKFESSVRVNDLFWMESLLGGTTPPTKHNKFGGLQHPKWDEALLGKIDKTKQARGEKLYAELCQGCHLPPISSKAFWADKHWTKADKSGRRFLDLPIVSLDYLGTDPEEAKVLKDRVVNIKGTGINTEVFKEDVSWFTKGHVFDGGNGQDACKKITVKEAESVNFAFALGAAVQEVNDHWYKANKVPLSKQEEMDGYRINCLRAPNAYKARPLNGIWATAPYLHNGAVPSIYALLSPHAERPASFYLGDLEYDVKNLGYRSTKKKHYFKLDTRKTGNSNKGHEFSNTKGKGVIGRQLTESERYDIIEYLKDI